MKMVNKPFFVSLSKYVLWSEMPNISPVLHTGGKAIMTQISVYFYLHTNQYLCSSINLIFKSFFIALYQNIKQTLISDWWQTIVN